MPGILSGQSRERILHLDLQGRNGAPLDVGGTLVLPVEWRRACRGARVHSRWIKGDSKVGTESASLEKYIFNHRYREIRNGQCSRKISGEKEAE